MARPCVARDQSQLAPSRRCVIHTRTSVEGGALSWGWCRTARTPDFQEPRRPGAPPDFRAYRRGSATSWERGIGASVWIPARRGGLPVHFHYSDRCFCRLDRQDRRWRPRHDAGLEPGERSLPARARRAPDQILNPPTRSPLLAVSTMAPRTSSSYPTRTRSAPASACPRAAASHLLRPLLDSQVENYWNGYPGGVGRADAPFAVCSP